MPKARDIQLIGIEEVWRYISFSPLSKAHLNWQLSHILDRPIVDSSANSLCLCVALLETFIYVFQRLSHVFVFRLCLSMLFAECALRTAQWHMEYKIRRERRRRRKNAKWQSIGAKTKVWQLVCSTVYLFMFRLQLRMKSTSSKEQTNWFFCVFTKPYIFLRSFLMRLNAYVF